MPAAEEYRNAVNAALQLIRRNPDNVWFKNYWVGALAKLAQLPGRSGEVREARKPCRDALPAARDLVKEGSTGLPPNARRQCQQLPEVISAKAAE